jgi:hypothetical protein
MHSSRQIDSPPGWLVDRPFAIDDDLRKLGGGKICLSDSLDECRNLL